MLSCAVYGEAELILQTNVGIRIHPRTRLCNIDATSRALFSKPMNKKLICGCQRATYRLITIKPKSRVITHTMKSLRHLARAARKLLAI